MIGVVMRIPGLQEQVHDPLLTYLNERPLPSRWVLGLHGRFFRLLSGMPRPTTPPPLPPSQVGLPGYWEALHEAADRASVGYRDRYRSSYVWVFGLATVAVLCAITSLVSAPLKLAATALEPVVLTAIALLVAVNQRRGWQARWIAYRLLAELCRKQEVLATLAWSLPPADRTSVAAGGSPEAWVGWYFNAARRASPLPTGTLEGERLETVWNFVRAKLVAGQAAYHAERKRVGEKVGRRLAWLGETLFLLTMAGIVVKLVILGFGGHDPAAYQAVVMLGILAALLPAVSAAFFGVRAYAELELLESRSARMAEVMSKAGAHLEQTDRPLASQDLAAEVSDMPSEMLQEVGGWAELFRVKAVEAG